MNAQLHPALAAALLPFAPPQSIVHRIVDTAAVKADLDYLHLLNTGELQRRHEARALELQRQYRPLNGGVL